MLSSLFNRLVSPRSGQKKAVRRPAQRFARLGVERLEEREVLSSPGSLAIPNLGAALVAPAAHHHQAAQVIPLKITNVSINGAPGAPLEAHGTLGNAPFTAPLTLTATPAATPGGTPILDLDLGPIDLNVLGLEVKTSPICLDITAIPGSGHLLGNLLSDVANLLNSGTPLGDILGGLSPRQTSTLTNGLTNLLNGALKTATSPSAVTSPLATTGGATDILHLSVGPLNLNLLGLNVHLDNCSNGPVTVDVIAHSGPGNLLGNLVTGLSNLLNNSNPVALGHELTTLINDVTALL